MKRNHKQMWRTVIALILTFTLVFGTASTAFATSGVTPNAASNEINYVSIGDSMSNGYGFIGYNQNKDGQDGYDFINDVDVYGDKSYPMQFEKYLTDKGYDVTHKKLAPSGLIARDLLFLLGGAEYEEDGWGGYESYVYPYVLEEDEGEKNYKSEELRAYFQNAVADADIMTMCLGNATFGAYLNSKITDVLRIGGGSPANIDKAGISLEKALAMVEDEEAKALVMETYESFYEDNIAGMDFSMLDDPTDDPDLEGGSFTGEEKVERIARVIAYATAIHIVSYKAVLERIDELNDNDLEIILVGLMNTFNGVEITDDNDEVILEFGKMMDDVFGYLNAYMAGLPTTMQGQGELKDITFYYAEKMDIKSISDIFPVAYNDGKWDGKIDGIDNTTLRNRTINAVADSIPGMPENLKDWVYDAEHGSTNDWDYIFAGIYKGIEKFVAENMSKRIPLSGMLQMSKAEDQLGGTFDQMAVGTAFYTAAQVPPDATLTPEQHLAGEAGVQEYVYNALTDLELQGMAAIFGLFQIGDGLSLHPTPAAHDELAELVIEAYESGYTAKAESQKLLLEYMNENYPNLMAAIGSGQGVAGNVDDLTIIMAALKASNNPALADVDLDELEAQIRELNKYVDTELAPEDQAFVMELSNDVMDRVQNLASKATSYKYEPTEESYYVALGDANSNAGAPAELAKKLYGDEWEKFFAQKDVAGIRSEEMLSMLEDEDLAAELEKADLISVALGSGDMTSFVTEQLERTAAGEDLIEMDWAKVGVESNATMEELNDLLDVAVPIIDLLGLADKYMPEGVNVDKPAKFGRVLVESLLYGYASYNHYYAQVLDKIHEINPEAQLVVLGMFNPVDEWTYENTIDGEETVVPLGGIINNVLEGTNIQTLAYALQTEKTTFVDLSDNVTTFDDAIAKGKEPTFADYFNAVLGGEGVKAEITAEGQKYMTEQMYAVLQETYMDNEVKVAIEFFLPLIIKYYDEAYMYAYRYAKDQGYIDEAVKGIDEAIAAMKELQAELDKLTAKDLGMTEELFAEIKSQIPEIIETLEAAKALILEADVLDQATLDAFLALLTEAGQDMNELGETLAQAGIDTYNLVIIPLLEEAYDILINEVLPQVDKQLQIAVKKGTEWLVEKINEYYPLFIDWLINEALPGADKAMYDWLYENPETVIGFFAEYGDEMAPIIEEYGDEAALVLLYALYTYGPDAVEWAIENPEEAIAKWVEWYNKHGHKVWPMIEKYLKTMDEMGMFDDIKAAMKDAAEQLEAYVIAYAEKVVAELEAINEAALAELKAAIEAADVDAILAALEELYDAGVAIWDGATTGYYAATEDSYYVALGDTNVEYAEIVAEELDLEKDQFVNYGIEDMTAAELKAYLNAGDEDLIAEIEKADLITLGFSNNTITKAAADALAAVMAGETVEFDWAPYVGKDGAAAMDAAIEAMEAALVAEGIMDAETLDMMVTVVEAYAFACTEFACNYPEAINAIKAINPEAQVVVVGMYNPFENAVVEFEGTQIPVGDYVGMLVDLANVHYTSYALLTGNAVYVHAPAVEIQAPFEEAMDITGFAAVLTDLDSLEPSASGNEYIAHQIIDAMNVVSKAVYDAQKLIDQIKAFGEVTRDNLADAKALAEAARAAWDKLTDEEKALIGLDNYKVLVDFELAVAKVELGVAEDIAAAEKALAAAQTKAAEVERALKITDSTVTNLKAKVVNKSQIKVTWKAPETTPDQYRVTLLRAGKKVGTYWVSGTKSSVTLKNILRGTNFTVRVTPVAKVDGKKYFSIYKTSNKVKTQLQKANLTVKKAGLKKQIISKDQNSTGFQIYISQNKNFKKNVKKLVYQTNKKGLNVKVKAKNFKKGTNYVKVRAYTKVNGKKVYGAWSGTVKVVK